MSKNLDILHKNLDELKIKKDNLYKEHEKLFKIGGYCDRLYNNGYIDVNQYFINKYNYECKPEIKLLTDKILNNNRDIKSITKNIDIIYDQERRKL